MFYLFIICICNYNNVHASISHSNASNEFVYGRNECPGSGCGFGYYKDEVKHTHIVSKSELMMRKRELIII